MFLAINASAGNTLITSKLDSTLLLMGKKTAIHLEIVQDKGAKGFLINDVVDTLNAYDLKFMMNKAEKINERVGLDTSIIVKCGRCGYDVVTTFRIEPEFFGPSFN